jgi:hypothetical protein
MVSHGRVVVVGGVRRVRRGLPARDPPDSERGSSTYERARRALERSGGGVAGGERAGGLEHGRKREQAHTVGSSPEERARQGLEPLLRLAERRAAAAAPPAAGGRRSPRRAVTAAPRPRATRRGRRAAPIRLTVTPAIALGGYVGPAKRPGRPDVAGAADGAGYVISRPGPLCHSPAPAGAQSTKEPTVAREARRGARCRWRVEGLGPAEAVRAAARSGRVAVLPTPDRMTRTCFKFKLWRRVSALPVTADPIDRVGRWRRRV